MRQARREKSHHLGPSWSPSGRLKTLNIFIVLTDGVVLRPEPRPFPPKATNAPTPGKQNTII